MTISPPTAFTRSMVSFTLSRLRSTAKIFAPSSAKRTAVARPLPQPGPTQPAPVTIAIRSCRRPLMMWLQSDGVPAETVETLRIIYQQGLSPSLSWRDLGQEINQNTIVGNRPLMIRMRPIGAPDAAVAKFSNQLARELGRISIRRALPGDTV